MSWTRASSGSSRLVAMTPVARTLTPPGPGSMRPYPVATSPGSMPRTRVPGGSRSGSRYRLEDVVGYVVVRVDGLNVVELLQRFDQAHDRGRVLAFHPDRGLRHVGHLALEHRNGRLLQRLAHRFHLSRRGGDLENFFDALEVGRARLQRPVEQRVLADLLG